jgi:hypothetical protein
MQRIGEGKTEPVFVVLDCGVSFAAEFNAPRVKLGWRWTQAEAKSFTVHSKMRQG